MFLSLWLLLLSGFAYESDQLTDRQIPLRDASSLLNEQLDALLSEAVERTNRRTRCRGDLDRMHRKLARQVFKRTAKGAFVWQRGFFRAPGFSVYSAWIERSQEVDKRSWALRDDLYGDATLWQSFILTVVGPASTVAVDGDLVGTDKFDHFLNFGFVAYKKSRWGREPHKIEDFDRRTERNFFGLVTSKTYSYGDIAANNDGTLFYSGLLDEDSIFQRDADGCVTQVREFDWGEWVDWRYDEALNPSVYTRPVQEVVTKRIHREPARYCAAYEALGRSEYDGHLEDVLAETPAPVRWMHERTDPYGLEALCAGRAPQ